MASLKVFVSSTCYDLGMVRAELRNYLINLGHDPVMSDYNDVLFDPKDHTHESCIKEIQNVDAVVLIIGSRYGGRAIPKAISDIDIEKLKQFSKSTKLLEVPANISITQLEIFKAIESNIPVFTFVDARVLHDHLFYEKNKDKGIIDSIEFPSIEKKEAAIYIFEFINFLRLRSKNNSIIEFTKVSDIEHFVKRQWSALLQRLLYEQRFQKNENKRIENLSEELKDIKSLILTSISSSQIREVGKGVLKFRRLIEFLLLFNKPEVISRNVDWDELIELSGIVEVKTVNLSSKSKPATFFLKDDGTFFEYRYPINILPTLISQWSLFRQLPEPVKREIVESVLENGQRSMPILKYRNEQFDDFIGQIKQRVDLTTITRGSAILNHRSEAVEEDGDNRPE